MSTKQKVAFAVMGFLIFIVSGGIACTYSTTNAINPILVVILGTLIFLAVGSSACAYSNNKISKTKVK
jgi:hypothetical protein